MPIFPPCIRLCDSLGSMRPALSDLESSGAANQRLPHRKLLMPSAAISVKHRPCLLGEFVNVWSLMAFVIPIKFQVSVQSIGRRTHDFLCVCVCVFPSDDENQTEGKWTIEIDHLMSRNVVESCPFFFLPTPISICDFASFHEKKTTLLIDFFLYLSLTHFCLVPFSS